MSPRNSDALFSARKLFVLPGLAVLSAAIVAVCRLFFEDFFFIDDAQKEHLPFFREMGALWLSGQLPVLTTRSFLGGNILVDMVLSPFAPQTIATSLIAATSGSLDVPVLFFAWINVFIISVSGWWLGKIFRLPTEWGVLLGFLLATQPVFLYVYAAAWWNLASAYSWFLFSFAALLQFRDRPARWSYVAALAGACFLFASAGTQMQLGYGLMFLAVILLDSLEHRDMRRVAMFAFLGVSALLMSAVPLMMDYAAAGDLVARSFGFHNINNALVPNWGQVLNFFNPLFGSYMQWFKGFGYIPISLGYATLLGLSALMFFRWNSPFDINNKILLVFLLLALLLSFSPSQMGPMRWPFRYLPLLSAALSLYLLERMAFGGIVVTRARVFFYFGVAAFAALLTLFSSHASISDPRSLQSGCGVFVVLGAAGLVMLRAANRSWPRQRLLWASALLSVVGLIGSLALTPTLGGTQLGYAHLPKTDLASPGGEIGYILGLCGGSHGEQFQREMVMSAQGLYRSWSFINGYSPVGHTGFSGLFPHKTAHGYFSAPETLKRLSQPAEGLQHTPLHRLFRISQIYACERHLAPDVRNALEKGGLAVRGNVDIRRVLIEPTVPPPTEGSLAAQSGVGAVKLQLVDGMRKEAYTVQPSAEARTLIFSRLFWPGYEATVDGKAVPVSAYMGALVRVDLPPGTAGDLVVEYIPMVFRYGPASLVAGLVCTLVAWWLLGCTARTQRRET